MTPPKRVRVPFERSGLSTAIPQRPVIQSLHALLDVTAMIAYVPAEKAWMDDLHPHRLQGSRCRPSTTTTRHVLQSPDSEERLAVIRKLRFDISGLRLIVGAGASGGHQHRNELDGPVR